MVRGFYYEAGWAWTQNPGSPAEAVAQRPGLAGADGMFQPTLLDILRFYLSRPPSPIRFA